MSQRGWTHHWGQLCAGHAGSAEGHFSPGSFSAPSPAWARSWKALAAQACAAGSGAISLKHGLPTTPRAGVKHGPAALASGLDLPTCWPRLHFRAHWSTAVGDMWIFSGNDLKGTAAHRLPCQALAETELFPGSAGSWALVAPAATLLGLPQGPHRISPACIAPCLPEDGV